MSVEAGDALVSLMAAQLGVMLLLAVAVTGALAFFGLLAWKLYQHPQVHVNNYLNYDGEVESCGQEGCPECGGDDDEDDEGDGWKKGVPPDDEASSRLEGDD